VATTKFIQKVLVCVQQRRDVQRNSTNLLLLLHLAYVSRNYRFVSTRVLFQKQISVPARDVSTNEFALVQLVLVRKFLLAISMFLILQKTPVSVLEDSLSCFVLVTKLERNLVSVVH